MIAAIGDIFFVWQFLFIFESDVLPVSLDCSFSISTSVFSNVYLNGTFGKLIYWSYLTIVSIVDDSEQRVESLKKTIWFQTALFKVNK
jgi:hypothetical protein